MFQFVVRDSCPTCTADPGPALADLGFDQPPISDYLKCFYDGHVDPSTLTEGRFCLVRCPECELIYQRYVPGPNLLKKLYDDATGADAEEGRARKSFAVRRGYAFQVEQLMKYFSGREVEVLDFGMGWGTWLQMAQAFGCRAVGAELSWARAESAPTGIDVLSANELPAGRFHFINTEQVFEHLVEPLEVGHKLVAALRPGGVLRISVPNGSKIPTLLVDADWEAPKGSPRSMNAVAPLEHLNCFDHASLVRFGALLGLEPFQFPARQYFEPWERARFMASALVHVVRKPRGTMLLFRKP
jgi:SAM-dependent methyltransferase